MTESTKEYKIRKGLKYNYIVSVPEEVVQEVGINAMVSYDVHRTEDGTVDAVVMFVKKQGEKFTPEKKKPGPKSGARMEDKVTCEK